MSFSLEKDTLGYQLKGRPGTMYRDMTAVKCHRIAQSYETFRETYKHDLSPNPEHDAIWFYMTNHAVAEVRSKFDNEEPLGEVKWVLDEYHRHLSHRATRMFLYCFLICTREARHVYDDDTMWNDMKAENGSSFMNFMSAIRGKSSDGAVQRFLSNPPNCTLGQMSAGLVWTFYNGSFSGGYGGSAWGKVADCLNSFVTGEYSAEMFMDTAFTLCHNNGPIFNKGMLYACHSHDLKKILDVQRSGQIPKMVSNTESPYSTPEHREFCAKALQLLESSDFSGYVDWFTVEALGSMGSYPQLKKSQIAAHGEPESHTKMKQAADKKLLQEEMKAAIKKAELEANWLQVTTTDKVKKINRKELKL